jgi:hypothetical protein
MSDKFCFDFASLYRSPKCDSHVNVIGDNFRKHVIYNGPPKPRSELPLFDLFSSSMGTEYAIIWAMSHCCEHLFKYVTNPSKKVIINAIILDNNIFKDFKDQLSEDDLIELVKTCENVIWRKPGWIILYKLDPQPEKVVKAAISFDPEAIRAVNQNIKDLWNQYSNMRDEICEILITGQLNEDTLNHVPFRTKKIG